MRQEHKVLFPAFLVVFASFLAFSYGDLGLSEVNEVIVRSPTGYVVNTANAGVCNDRSVMGLFLLENSHVSEIGSGESVDYCADLSFDLAIDNPSRGCYADNSNLIAYVSNGFSVGPRFNWPMGIETVVDENSFTQVYVSDADNNCVRKINPHGIVEDFSGICGGNDFAFPVGLELIGDSFYVADRDNHCIKKISIDGNITEFSGLCGTPGTDDGLATDARFNQPTGISEGPSGKLIIADRGNHCIREVAMDGSVLTIAGTCGAEGDVVNVLGTDARFSNPSDVEFNPAENLIYISDKDNNKIKTYDLIGTGVLTYAGSGGIISNPDLAKPYDMEYDVVNNLLYVTDTNNQKIKLIDVGASTISVYAGTGTVGLTDGNLLDAQFFQMSGIDLDAFGNLFISDSLNHAIRVATGGTVYTLAGNGSAGLYNGVLVGGGHIYAPESSDSELPPKGYYSRICYEEVQCQTYVGAIGNSKCGGVGECLLSFGDGNGLTYNAHAASCIYYTNKLCCSYLEPGSAGVCGDGILNPGEQCDDGNLVNGDGCDEFCQIEPSVDTDGDGLIDSQDNCPLNPNNGIYGTCIDASTLSNPLGNLTTFLCGSNDDCIGKTVDVNNITYTVEHCELTQANEDGDTLTLNGDACGNACDIDSNDRLTCFSTGDQGSGGGGSECTLALAGASFAWSTNYVERGETVDLILDLAGDIRCDGVVFDVDVLNDETGELSVVKPGPLTVIGSTGSTNWVAENNNPGSSADNVTWKAKGYNIGGGVAPPSDLLEVYASNSYCGDGHKDSGEQCDDGNNIDGDGCNEYCLIEGYGGTGGGDACSSYCVRGTAVCTATGVAYCGDYDGDGCNELSNEVTCPSGETCNPEFGNCAPDSCRLKNVEQVSPTCPNTGDYDWVCGTWTDCKNGERTRTCIPCNAGSCLADPLERVDCSLEPSVKGSVFDLMGLIIALGILMIYYMFRNNKLVVVRSS